MTCPICAAKVRELAKNQKSPTAANRLWAKIKDVDIVSHLVGHHGWGVRT